MGIEKIMLNINRKINNSTTYKINNIQKRGISMIVPTRQDYGGRTSRLCASLPLWVFSVFITVIFWFHSSHYGSLLWLSWLILGLIFMVNEWVRVGVLESRFQYTMSARINTLGSFACLVVFESCFFAGVFWIFAISRIHCMPEVSHRGASAGNDLSVFGSFESSPFLFSSHSLPSDSGYLYFNSNFSQNLLGENLLSIYLNLWILLAVSLLLQFMHRSVQISSSTSI